MIKTINLTKKYDDMYAIRGIDLDLQQGDLFGFIGPNGAGKTTTMRIIATLLAPTYGEAYVCGHSIYTHPKEIRRLVGFMPDFFGVYDDMTVIEYLEFFAAAYKIQNPERRKRCNEMLEVVDLDFKRDAYANTLSRG
ncbi:MAG: ABC transporter ATP-binding protein, partial [Pirellulaceae bacterium]